MEDRILTYFCLFLSMQLILAKPHKSIQELKSGIPHPERILSPIIEDVSFRQVMDDDLNSLDAEQSSEDVCANVYCRLGRVCQTDSDGFAHCVCAPVGYCDGHRKQVCGTDGELYQSHCELHRMACVKMIHIRIDHSGKTCTAKKENSEKLLVREERIDLTPEKKPPIEEKIDTTADSKAEGDKKTDDQEKIDKTKKENGEKQVIGKAEDEKLVDMSKANEQRKTSIVNKNVTNDGEAELECSKEQYKEFKEALIRYHCARIGEVDCLSDAPRQHFVVKVMLNYYDANGDRQVSPHELQVVEEQDKLEELSLFCQLTNLITVDDADGDGQLSISEFTAAFDLSEGQKHVQVFHTLVTSGNSVELMCDVATPNNIIWMRNGVKINDIESEDIKVSKEGSLYIKELALQHMGNYTCHDSMESAFMQTHILRVQVPPTVKVSPHSNFELEGNNLLLRCHAAGLPTPELSWEFNQKSIPTDMSQKHLQLLNSNSSLEVRNIVYSNDTGAYKCKAKNTAGSAEDVAVVYVEKNSKPRLHRGNVQNEIFLVFHHEGYTVYDPTHCLLEHRVKASYSSFKLGPYSIIPKTLCDPVAGCSWGGAANVQDKYVFVTQPKLNRVVVIEVSDRYNPFEIIPVDNVPVDIYYLEQLDQVWVLCWNKLDEDSTKTVLVIRNASRPAQHHTVHVQGLGNRFDLVKDVFLPPSVILSTKFHHAYVTKKNEMDLYKLDLSTLQYTKVVHLHNQGCYPQSVAFLSIGGQILVHCKPAPSKGTSLFQLVVDYITDEVKISHQLKGEPQVSPDSKYVVQMDKEGNTITVHTVHEDGTLEYAFEDVTSIHASSTAFFHAESGLSYDFYVSSKKKNDLMYINLVSGKMEIIEGVGQAMPEKEWPWSKKNRAIVSSSYFSDYLVTPAKDSVLVINGRHRHTQCEWQDITHANVFAWVKVTL